MSLSLPENLFMGAHVPTGYTYVIYVHELYGNQQHGWVIRLKGIYCVVIPTQISIVNLLARQFALYFFFNNTSSSL